MRFSTLLLSVAMIAIPAFFGAPSSVNAQFLPRGAKLVICRDSNQQLYVRKKCRNGDTVLNDSGALLSDGAGAAGFVRFGPSGGVAGIGGTTTTSVSVTRLSTGRFEATFNGVYDSLPESDDGTAFQIISAFVTPIAQNFESGAIISIAGTRTEVVIEFDIHSTQTQSGSDGLGGQLVFFIGRTP